MTVLMNLFVKKQMKLFKWFLKLYCGKINMDGMDKTFKIDALVLVFINYNIGKSSKYFYYLCYLVKFYSDASKGLKEQIKKIIDVVLKMDEIDKIILSNFLFEI